MSAEPTPQLQADAAELFGRAIRLLTDNQVGIWVSEAAMRQTLKRLDSTFDAREYGYANFLAMLKGLDAVVEAEAEVETLGGEAERQIRLRCS